MIIPAEKRSRRLAWLTIVGIVVSVILVLSVGVYRVINNKSASPIAGTWMLPSRLTPTSTPVTPQKTSEYMRGTYVTLEKDALELIGTAGSMEKVRIGDRTEFTCAPRFIRDAKGSLIDTANIYLIVKPGSNYIIRSSPPSFLGRLTFESTVKPGDIVLVALGSIDDAAFRVSLMTDPCDPEKWKL